MNIVDNITSYPLQQLGLSLPSGDKAILTLKYMPRLLAWYMYLTYGNITLSNRRVYASPNMLLQWDKVFPFGLACFSNDGSDPYYLNDFETGRCGLLLLDSTETASYEDYLSTLKNE